MLSAAGSASNSSLKHTRSDPTPTSSSSTAADGAHAHGHGLSPGGPSARELARRSADWAGVVNAAKPAERDEQEKERERERME